MTSPHERGAIPVEWALGIGLLVLPVAMLVALFPEWAERQAAARVAAREAARVAALAEDPVSAATVAAAVAREVAANHGLSPEELTVTLDLPLDGDGSIRRDGAVAARAEVQIPLVAVPLAGSAGGWTWAVTHREPLDRYRSLPP